jgi:hypothetical protein
MSDKNDQKLFSSVFKLLRPLVKLLLRHGIPYNVFADMARHAYVDVATEEFTLPGRKQTVSRVSVLTGINRKDIAKLHKRPHPLENDTVSHLNRASRVVNAWLTGPQFQDVNAQPKALPIEGGGASFSELVRRYSGDVTVGAVLDELQRINAVSVTNETVHLQTQAYVPEDDMEEKLRIFGTAAADLLSTLTHNLDHQAPQKRVQRSVFYSNIPRESLPEIRTRSNEEVQVMLVQMNQWLSQYDRDENKEITGTGQARAGIGIYYFEENIEQGKPE